MVTASALLRDCGHPRVLRAAPPADARARAARAKRDAAAGRGTVFHRAIEQWVTTGTPGTVDDPEIQGWIDILAAQWAPPLGTRLEVPWGLGTDGGHVHVDEPEPHVYVARGGQELITAGRADACWLSYGWLYVVDWKTGRWPVAPAESNLQVNAAGLALAREVSANGYVPGIYYARDGVFEWGRPVSIHPHLPDIWAEIQVASVLDDSPRPGPHCASCWERRACPSAALP